MTAIDLSNNRVDDGFFVLNGRRSSPFTWPVDNGEGYRFVGAYRDSGAPIRDALLEMIRGARRRVFVASFMIGDKAVLDELLKAAARLRGGVYIITALDEQSLRRGLAEFEDQEQEAPEERRKNFERLTTNGIYVRGHESCHAKFAVVDDSIALAGSANFVANGFEWTGEANLVIRDPFQVGQLARLFTALWYEGCQWEVPPGETYQIAQRQSAQTPVSPNRPETETVGVLWTNEAHEPYLHRCICDVIARAKRQITLASYSVTGMREKPHLLVQPLREALARGVSVRLFVRQRNPNSAQRADLCCLSDLGVEIYGDLRNHAKGIVADGTCGALFSCNFDGAHGLESGVEVGVRLDGQPALKELERYIDHAIDNGDVQFVRRPTLKELDGKLAAKWCKKWPWAEEIRIASRWSGVEAFAAAVTEGPVLFEQMADDNVQLYAGALTLSLTRPVGHCEATLSGDESDTTATQRLESWLGSVRRPKERESTLSRGFCPAKLEFVHT